MEDHLVTADPEVAKIMVCSYSKSIVPSIANRRISDLVGRDRKMRSNVSVNLLS
jgi:hypothetical protein